LVVTTPLKIRVKMGIFPKYRGEFLKIKKYLKPPPIQKLANQ